MEEAGPLCAPTRCLTTPSYIPFPLSSHPSLFCFCAQTKDGKPRFYKLDSLIHYGAIPQTFEDPDHKDARTGFPGDGDPVDVCEIAVHRAVAPGSVYKVKVLGALAMIDGGETDWKILAVRAGDPLAATVDDVATAPDSVLKLAEQVKEW